MARHGTYAGWGAHQRLGERPCDACYNAKSEYDKRQRDIPAAKLKSRINARAQGMARGDLIRSHPDEYTTLYQRYKEDLMIEAGLIEDVEW